MSRADVVITMGLPDGYEPPSAALTPSVKSGSVHMLDLETHGPVCDKNYLANNAFIFTSDCRHVTCLKCVTTLSGGRVIFDELHSEHQSGR